MTIAEIHNKLNPKDIRLKEDLLTSDVFGAFSYLSPKDGIIPFLKKALNSVNQELGSRENWNDAWNDIDYAEYNFWPRMSDRSQPDVVISLYSKNELLAAIIVECKYTAPIDNDQLEVELSNLEVKLSNLNDIEDKLKKARLKVVLLVTADTAFPVEKLSSIKDVFWDSWISTYKCGMEALSHNQISRENKVILKDLTSLLYKKGFNLFISWDELEKDIMDVKESYSLDELFSTCGLFNHKRF